MIEIKCLTKYYQEECVFSDVSLTIGDEIVTIFGFIGSGKTTLLRLIAGLEKPDGGEILIDGNLVSKNNFLIPACRRKVNMVFQDLALWPHMTVYEHLEFSLSGLKGKKASIDNTLSQFGLVNKKDKLPYELSGGQQQKLALARAIITKPRILLLDEPLTSLDSAGRSEIKTIIKNIFQTEKIAIVYITHDLLDALEMGERFLLFYHGKTEEIKEAGKFLKSSDYEAIKHLLENLRQKFISN
ncbi:MAG: ATP-binding cassette domain-containing protein [Candidatus Saelkia tenebricola]|nr:ATP-binding cassette domain-containing protein [Candidatus Saelkia tenebricola]